MSFKKILVPLADVDSDAEAIDAALHLGREFGAQIVALYAKMANGNPSTNRTKLAGSVERENGFTDETEVERARTLFRNCCASHRINWPGDIATEGLSAKFLELQGIEADLIAQHGRVSDLTVFTHPNSHEFDWPNISIQTVLRETSRPVLLVPRTITRVGQRSIIAWNGSLESARAIAFAIPILLRSADTLVVTVDNYDVQPSGEDVVDYLKCHGIFAKSMVVPIEQESESLTLLAAASNFDADLTILGAYTRHRSGRPVFGSMTIEMIEQKQIAVFMSH